MTTIRSMLADQSSVGEPERRGDERSEAPRSGGSPTLERERAVVLPDAEVPARHARRRFTTAYKLEILRKADACTRHGELGALLRKEGLYSSHVVTWRRQREHGLTPKTRGRKPTAGDPRLKKVEREKAALATLTKQWKLDPTRQPHRLGRSRDPKVAVSKLTGGDEDRAWSCIEDTALSELEQRGAATGLTGFIADLRAALLIVAP